MLYFQINIIVIFLGLVSFVPFLVLPHPLSSLTLGGPALCLNFGPSSELGVNEGVGSLLVSFFGGVFMRFFFFLCSPF